MDDALTELRRRDDVNVLFILIDTLRADRLSAYGYQRPTSPVMKALADSGIRFATVRSQSSWTKASMASIWTASYPARTGILRFQHAISDEATMPAEILREAGFYTAAIWRNGWIAPNFGFGQGFNVYFRPTANRTPERFQQRNPSAHPLLGTDLDLTESAREFSRTFGSQRFFLYLHYMDVHQYVYNEESALFGVRYPDAYDNAIRWDDTNIGLVAATLEEHDLLEKTLIVIASDHGEAFSEHGREGHGKDLYREVTEVPLILVLPDLITSGIVVKPMVQNVDIWPTIFDMLGLPPLEGAQGRSLLPLIRGTVAQSTGEETMLGGRPAFAHLDRTWGREDVNARRLVSVTSGRYRLFHPVTPPGKDQLFDLGTDPQEQADLVQDQPQLVESLREEIARYLQDSEAPWGAPREVEIDEMHLGQLRALGYMAGGGRQ